MAILSFIIFLLVGLNFFYRAIHLLKTIRKISFSENKRHRFKCTSCDSVYTLNGVETKQQIKGSLRKQKKGIKHTQTFFKFPCPTCQQKVYQEKLFDINKMHQLKGFQIQMDSEYIGEYIDFFIKGILPILIALPIIKF